jgi:hypothetical protein
MHLEYAIAVALMRSEATTVEELERLLDAPNEAVFEKLVLRCIEVVGGRQALSTGPARPACREPVEALK